MYQVAPKWYDHWGTPSLTALGKKCFWRALQKLMYKPLNRNIFGPHQGQLIFPYLPATNPHSQKHKICKNMKTYQN